MGNGFHFLDEVALPGWVKSLITAMENVINPILILAAAAGLIYAIVVGFKFIKAEEKEQREEAKQKLIYVIIGIVVTVVLIALFYFLIAALKNGWINFHFIED